MYSYIKMFIYSYPHSNLQVMENAYSQYVFGSKNN
jgi:hypothetical protein